MKKTHLLNLILGLLLPFSFFSCTKEADPPQPDFNAAQYSTSSDISITFTDLSSNSPNQWLWTFEGGYPSTSTLQNPTVTYSTSGTYDVSLLVKNSDGENQIVRTNYINVGEFDNPTWTDIDITVNSVTKTIPVDGYVLFANIDNTLMSYYAETSGSTSGGTQIGLLLYWDNTKDLTEYTTWYLDISSDYVFINVTNYGLDNLTPFYVNYGTSEQSVDDIIIENDGVKKATGYYDAYDNMEIRANFYSNQTLGVQWIENTNFNLPWVANQGLNLIWNPNKTSNVTNATTEFKSMKNKTAGIAFQTGSK